jgi:transcriptional regulator with XRE-family HTH domain
MRKKQDGFADQLRAAIENCGKSRYQISKETGVPQDSLSRFVSGDRGLSMESIEQLFENLGLKISKR